jgi:hypothetical protein
MTIRAEASEYISPIIVYLIGLVCPAIPSVLVSIFIKAMISGDIGPDHITALLSSVGLKTYPQDGYPGDPKSPPAQSNINPPRGQ